MLNNSSTSDTLVYYCSKSEVERLISSGIIEAKTIFVLPLSIFVLYLGLHRWRRQRSFKTASHSDIFTYHLAVLELFWGFGLIFYLSGTYCVNMAILTLGFCGFSITFFGEVFFHLLTCVERYLAVVHPVTYLLLRNTRGVRIRNISIGCVWLLCFGLTAFYSDVFSKTIISAMLFFFAFSIIIVITFCSVSVLCVLIRPGPGDGGREKVDQMKQRAFQTILAISSVLWLWVVGLLVCYALSISPVLSESVECLLNMSIALFNLPTSLVSPLLYLNRAGKLQCNWSKPE